MTERELLGALAQTVRADGGLPLGTIVDPVAGAPAPHGVRCATGPLAEGDEATLALVIEAVREGYLLHYAPDAARVVRTDDHDLALLAGDRLYALGLALLAELGRLDAIAELTDVIALGAGAHAARLPDLAEAVWEAGVTAIGWGSSDALQRAKDRARITAPAAAADLRAAASDLERDGAA